MVIIKDGSVYIIMMLILIHFDRWCYPRWASRDWSSSLGVSPSPQYGASTSARGYYDLHILHILLLELPCPSQNFSRIIHTCSIVKHYGYMHHVYMHHGYMHHGYMYHGYIHHGYMYHGYMHHGYMHHGHMHHGHICVGHTAWAPEGHNGRSQGGPKGRKLEVGARRAPWTSSVQ